MAHIKIQPPGVMPLSESDRKPVIRVNSGDTWSVSLNLYNPADCDEHATPDNTIVKAVLAETQFDKPIWTGGWYDGVYPDRNRRDLCWLRVPASISNRLRRGSYQFSVRVHDMLKAFVATEAEGSFLVEYKPSSENHSIPYKDGTSEHGKDKIIHKQEFPDVPTLNAETAAMEDVVAQVNSISKYLKDETGTAKPVREKEFPDTPVLDPDMASMEDTVSQVNVITKYLKGKK